MSAAIGIICILLAVYFLDYDTPLGDAAGIPLGLVGLAFLGVAVLT